MAKHILALSIPNTTNEGILLIDDISVYDTVLPVTCPNLQITPAGFTYPASIEPDTKGFRLVLSACTIGIVSPGGCATGLPALPDGIWDIRYSVSPNDGVFVSYKILRVVKALNRYMNLLGKLRLPTSLPTQELIYQLQQLDLIYNFILSAKVTVEDFHIYDDGINQLRYAESLMDKMSSSKPFC